MLGKITSVVPTHHNCFHTGSHQSPIIVINIITMDYVCDVAFLTTSVYSVYSSTCGFVCNKNKQVRAAIALQEPARFLINFVAHKTTAAIK